MNIIETMEYLYLHQSILQSCHSCSLEHVFHLGSRRHLSQPVYGHIETAHRGTVESKCSISVRIHPQKLTGTNDSRVDCSTPPDSLSLYNHLLLSQFFVDTYFECYSSLLNGVISLSVCKTVAFECVQHQWKDSSENDMS